MITPENNDAGSGCPATTCSLDLSRDDMKRVLNAVHERASRLIDLWTAANHTGFRKPNGELPTKEERDQLYEGQKAHFDLQERIRAILKANASVEAAPNTKRP